MPEVPAVPGAGALVDRVGRIFDPGGGPLAARLEDYEPRGGQVALARAVADTFTDGGILLAEAGTGIGKTLAYLVPGALAGRRVLISTGTRNLQDQVFHKDIPALSRVLGTPIRAAYMKGRTNYLCLHRYERLNDAAGSLAPHERDWMERIAEWLPHTSTGDRAELDDLPDDSAFWFEVTATSEQCIGRDCPRVGDCFITRMRETAADAALVVVNHHLLCADASVRQGEYGEVIPECDLLVVDEAHQLEDVATQYFGVALGTHRLEELVRDATSAASLATTERGRAVSISETASEVLLAGRTFFDIARLEARSRSGGDRVKLTPDMAHRLDAARERLSEALSRLASAFRTDNTAPADDVARLILRTTTMRGDLETLTAADDDRYVHFIEQRGRSLALRAAPIDASTLIRDQVIGSRHAAVLASATLTVEGTFDYAKTRLGVADAATLRVPSEFDYTTQSILYLPPDMPDPRTPEFNARGAQVIHDLLGCTRGRAFVLFTSYAAMREVHAALEGVLEWPIFVQGTAPRRALLRDFRATPHAVLFATASFWQGVDVAGEALSCVIIDRLPFASPGDPLVEARIAAIAGRGGNAFRDYQVPLATLSLLQGLGRLIRTRTDRGVLAVLDPRLVRMPYGQRFLASMPPSPITDSLDDVRGFFEG